MTESRQNPTNALPNDSWLYRRILVFIITIGTFALSGYIAVKTPDYRIALAALGLNALANALYLILATSSFEKILAYTVKIITEVKE